MNALALRHRPGTQVRGEETRRRILDTALEMFAAQGYEATSTRLLADRAGVNLPAIQYYFGSKEGLYRAVIAAIVEHNATFMAPLTAKVQALLARNDAAPEELIEALCEIFERFVTLISCGDQNEHRRLLYARAEVEPTPGLEMLHESGRQEIFEPCLKLVARLLGRSTEDPATVLRTMALFGQVTIFCHTGARRLMGGGELREERIVAIRALVREQTRAILHDALAKAADAAKTSVEK